MHFIGANVQLCAAYVHCAASTMPIHGCNGPWIVQMQAPFMPRNIRFFLFLWNRLTIHMCLCVCPSTFLPRSFFFCSFPSATGLVRLVVYVYRWIVYRTNSWGYLKNGTFDGMIGALVRKEIDVGGSPIFFRLERAMVIDYTARTWISRWVNCNITQKHRKDINDRN